jgi:uncharacterized protein
MRIDESEASDNVIDRRGEAGPQSGMGMGGMSFGGGGGRPGGSILGLLALLVIGYVLGINPMQLLGGGGGSASPQTDSGPVQAAPPSQQSPQEAEMFRRMQLVLGSTTRTWQGLLGAKYPEPKLNIFRNAVQTACGIGQAAAGPFYCPGDRQVYLDLAFFDELASRFGAPGDFAQAYVVAHEVGHHIQTITGIEDQVRSAQRGSNKNELQVRMELQADCYAGIWAHHAEARDPGFLEAGDLQEGLKAAFAVGDDTLQKQAQGYVQPDTFTHGSSEQRMSWFKRGFETGQVAACDTFKG